jgi:hypothetical protein
MRSILMPAQLTIADWCPARKEGGARVKRSSRFQIVPVWRRRIDHRTYVLALLAFAEQLAREAAASDPGQSTGGDDSEVQDD